MFWDIARMSQDIREKKFRKYTSFCIIEMISSLLHYCTTTGLDNYSGLPSSSRPVICTMPKSLFSLSIYNEEMINFPKPKSMHALIKDQRTMYKTERRKLPTLIIKLASHPKSWWALFWVLALFKSQVFR